MFDLERFIEDCREAVREDKTHKAAREVVARAVSDPSGVLNESGTDRYSIAYFHSPNPAATIECLPSCVSADNPARYAPTVYRDLVLEFYRANYFHQKGHKSNASQLAAAE